MSRKSRRMERKGRPGSELADQARQRQRAKEAMPGYMVRDTDLACGAVGDPPHNVSGKVTLGEARDITPDDINTIRVNGQVTVYLRPGVYNGPIHIPSGVALVGGRGVCVVTTPGSSAFLVDDAGGSDTEPAKYERVILPQPIEVPDLGL